MTVFYVGDAVRIANPSNDWDHPGVVTKVHPGARPYEVDWANGSSEQRYAAHEIVGDVPVTTSGRTIEVPVGDEQEFDYDAEIRCIEVCIEQLQEKKPHLGDFDRESIAVIEQAIYLLNCYADELNDQKENN